MSQDRRYDEKDVATILKRVAELHEREGERREGRGMSLSDLEQVADELGMSRALVARAAAEVDVAGDDAQRAGVPGAMLETVIEGELSTAAHDRMLEVVRRRVGDPGTLVTQGFAQIWSATAGMHRVHLTVTRDGGRTNIRLESRGGDEAVAMGAGGAVAGFLAGVFSLIPLKVLVAKPLMLLLIVPVIAAWVATGALVGWNVGRRRRLTQSAALRSTFTEVIALANEARRELPPSEPGSR